MNETITTTETAIRDLAVAYQAYVEFNGSNYGWTGLLLRKQEETGVWLVSRELLEARLRP